MFHLRSYYTVIQIHFFVIKKKNKIWPEFDLSG
jgi:hypothetical protein